MLGIGDGRDGSQPTLRDTDYIQIPEEMAMTIDDTSSDALKRS